VKKHVSGTQEWASNTDNLQTGCPHDCRYCYAKAMAIRFQRTTPEAWQEPVRNHVACSKGVGRRRGTTMFPSTHDITPDNVDVCIDHVRKLTAKGNKVLVVSKPSFECARVMVDAFAGVSRELLLFRFTIGSACDAVLSFWEPGAPCFAERVKALEMVWAAGYETSVSCEPMLDQRIGDVIRQVEPFVTDAIWLGKANRLSCVVAVNCPGDRHAMHMARSLMAIQSDVFVLDLYSRYSGHPKIKWKDSIKQVVGLARPECKGLDI
jgi:hypothetical protein